MNEHPHLIGVLAFCALMIGAALLSALTGDSFADMWFGLSLVAALAYLSVRP